MTELASRPLRHLAQSILDELDLTLDHDAEHRCQGYSPETPRPRCLPVKSPDNTHCLRCLSKQLLIAPTPNSKARGMVRDFYDQALMLNLTSRLLTHMVRSPAQYEAERWPDYATRMYEETKTLRSLQRRQKYFLSRMKHLDLRKTPS